VSVVEESGAIRADVVQVPVAGAPRPIGRDVPTDAAPTPDDRGRGTSPARTMVLKAMIVLADVATIAVAFLAATLLVAGWAGWSPQAVRDHLVVAAWTLPLWPILFARQHLYASRFLTRLFDEIRRAAHVVVLGVVAIVVVGWLLQATVSRGWLVAFLVLALVFVALERYAVRWWFVRRRRSGRSLRDVIIVGTNDEARDLEQSLSDPAFGYRVVGFVAVEPDAPMAIDGIPVHRGAGRTVDIASELGAQGVIVATTGLEVGMSNRLLRELLDAGLHVDVTSGLRDVTPERMTVRPLGRHPVVYLEPARRFGWRIAAKRVFDVALSVVALVVAAPLLAVSAVWIKVTSPGPVLFRQDRVGRDGRVLQVLKLRTMFVDAEDRLAELLSRNETDGPLFKISRDPRVTTAGRWLRKLSIDELPQLWNVIRGDMSLIGPRPALPREVEQWSDELHERLRVRPGITGMWQVSGRSSSGFEEYQRLDLFYVDNWSILIDIGILLRTVPTVITGRGAH
jgi:exopolysaccharide biosynthesis polyprenyl glycosylphosphotransferase